MTDFVKSSAVEKEKSLKDQLGHENLDHYVLFYLILCFCFKCDLSIIFLMSQNKSSIFYVLFIYIYLEKYIKIR